MNEQPLTEQDIANAVSQANNGKKWVLFLSWWYNGQWIVTKIKLRPDTKMDNQLRLKKVEHDWRPTETTKSIGDAFLALNPLNAVFDNYWMAYRHCIRMSKNA